MRLIDANRLIERMKAEEAWAGYIEDMRFEDAYYLVEEAPTVEAKPIVHAHWDKYDDSEFCYCSNCGKPAAEDDDVSWHGYCPVCGATMDEVVSK